MVEFICGGVKGYPETLSLLQAMQIVQKDWNDHAKRQ